MIADSPIADMCSEVQIQRMNDEPASYVKAALSGLGVECLSLKVEGYNPQVFGNFSATADTNVGEVRILYDREFYIETDRPLPAHLSVQRVVETLNRYKRLAASGS